MSITSVSDFDESTAFERMVLERAVDLLPTTPASRGSVFDLRTNVVSMSVQSIVSGEEQVADLKKSFLPLTLGAAWKVLDLAVELALGPPSAGRWLIAEKIREAPSAALQPFNAKVWEAFSELYRRTDEVRHSLIHRRAHVDAAGTLIGHDKAGTALRPMTASEQWAFCRAMRRLADAVLRGTISAREEADLCAQLNTLAAYQSVSFAVATIQRAPGLLIDNLAANSKLDVADLMTRATNLWPGINWVDLELHTPVGVLRGELDTAPRVVTTVDPLAPPPWLHR